MLHIRQQSVGDECLSSACDRRLSISNIDLTHPITVKYVSVSRSIPYVFATYVLLWVTQPYSWEDAETVCKDMGWHLASVSSEEEYFIVKGMLKGEEYQVNQGIYEVSPVTPCKLASPLCVVHIGMQAKVCDVIRVFRVNVDSVVCTCKNPYLKYISCAPFIIFIERA